MAVIILNHKGGCSDPVDRIDILTDKLITRRMSVLFVGEGNFTFTVAFAALRDAEKVEGVQENPGTWDGIISTRFESENDIPKPILSEVKLDCIDSGIKYFNRYNSDDEEMLDKIQKIIALPSAVGSDTWKYGIDALKLSSIPPEHELHQQIPRCGMIWFQCPWNTLYEVGELISDFLEKTATVIDEGVYVCIGITKFFPYIVSYSLENILGVELKAEDGSTKVLEYYTFVGADDNLIRELLKYGYHHQGNRDIHEQIMDDHVTLVFKRK